MKIGIISDRPSLTHTLHRAVSLQPRHHVAWIAESAPVALERCASSPPDVALLVLPGDQMDGVAVTGSVMAHSPCPILIVTDSLRHHAVAVLEAIDNGACDAVEAPAADSRTLAQGALPLLATIELVAGHALPMTASNICVDPPAAGPISSHETLVAIGASAGGPAAVATILKGLSPGFSAGIIVVQHLDDMFVPGMAEWLSGQCGRPVVVSREGDPITADRVMTAGAGGHLVVTASGRVGYSAEPRQCAYRPSVDVLFQSISRLWEGPVIGVLLTGMGRDGAVGLKALRDQGHHTIAQDQASSAVYGMPRAAAALNAVVDVLPLGRIAARIEAVARTAVRR